MIRVEEGIKVVERWVGSGRMKDPVVMEMFCMLTASVPVSWL